MRSLLEGRRVYIDTNVYVYVALKHPDFYEECYQVLDMLVSREFEGYGSQLVLFELFGALSRISVDAAYEAASSYLDLPLTMLEVSGKTLAYAREIASLSGTTYDSLHAALVAENGIEVVVTEDVDDWGKIAKAWPEIAKRHGAKNIVVLSPTRGVVGNPAGR